MKKRKNDLIVIIISIMVICINNVSLSKYDYIVNRKFNSEIAKSIIILKKDDKIKKQINKNLFPIEYNFSICNYDNNFINEVEFDYIINIESSAENFPVSYVLLDCDNNKEIKLKDGKSEKLKIKKSEKEERKFKLYLQWRDYDGEMEDEIKLNLKIDVIQSKEENGEN